MLGFHTSLSEFMGVLADRDLVQGMWYSCLGYCLDQMDNFEIWQGFATTLLIHPPISQGLHPSTSSKCRCKLDKANYHDNFDTNQNVHWQHLLRPQNIIMDGIDFDFLVVYSLR